LAAHAQLATKPENRIRVKARTVSGFTPERHFTGLPTTAIEKLRSTDRRLLTAMLQVTRKLALVIPELVD